MSASISAWWHLSKESFLILRRDKIFVPVVVAGLAIAYFANLASGWGLEDFEWLTLNAMKSAFAPFPERLRIINGLVKPRYALLKAELAMGTQTR